MDTTPSLALHPYAQKHISIKAEELVGKAGYRRADLPDIEQELRLYLIERSKDFDPNKGAVTTFIARWVDTKIAMLLRDRRRAKRAPGFQLQSLDITITGEDDKPASLASMLPDRSHENSSILSADELEAFQKVLATLPPDLQEVVRRRMSKYVANLDLNKGSSRRKLRNGIEQLRDYLKARGFE